MAKKRAMRARGRKPSTKKAGVSKPLKTYIKKAISRNQESKISTVYGINQDILTTAASTPTNISLLPTPNQGTGESDRVGNLIDVKKCVISGLVNLKKYDTTDTTPIAPGPFWVKMWVVSAKNVNTNTFSNTTAATTFFNINNSSVGFASNVRDMVLDVNNDYFTLHRYKMFKIGASSTSSVNNPAFYYDNSPMAVPFKFDLSKIVGKLRYDENQTWATNKNLFLVMSVARCDGSTGSSTVPNVEYHFKLDNIYKDA